MMLGDATKEGKLEGAQTAQGLDVLRSNARLRVLAEVSHAFAMVATDYPLLLTRIARTTADLVGDGCMVTLLGADGESLINAATAHRDAALEADYSAYLEKTGVSKTSSTSVSAVVIRTGEPKLVTDIPPAALVARSDDALKGIVARLNVHSYAVVPIRARQRTIGSLSLLRSGPGRGYTAEDVVMLQDLADRAGLAIENARLYDDLERRVRQRTAELETTNKELEAFSYSVAHDLRAPVRSIDGFTQVLLDDCADRLTSDEKDNLLRVRGAARRMGQLIDDLLSLSRVTRVELRRQRVDLSELACTILARLQAAQPERAVDVIVEPGLVAQADPRLADIALTNLLGNAWKFTAQRARARIEFAARAGDEPAVYFVRDNGAGFNPEYTGKLFGAFQRLHTAHEFEGSGIGLAIVDRIVERHGGRIWGEGEVDRGATFYFSFEPGSVAP